MLTCPPASEVPEYLAVPRAGVSRKEGVQLWPDLCPLQKVAWMQSLLLVLVKGQQGLRGPRSRVISAFTSGDFLYEDCPFLQFLKVISEDKNVRNNKDLGDT